ncbi:MAG TPA: hypothetical protein VIJ86_04455 [Acidimicrobiales bacterium]
MNQRKPISPVATVGPLGSPCPVWRGEVDVAPLSGRPPSPVVRSSVRCSGNEERLVGDTKARAAFSRGRDEDDFELAEIDAGQGVGLLSSTRSAEEIVHSFT